MELSLSALRTWWNKSSKKQRMLAALFLLGFLATGMLLILSGGSSSAPATPAAGATLFNANEAAADPLGSGWYYAGVIVKMLAVLLLIVGGAVVLHRWQARRANQSGRQLRVVESVRLSPKQALHLVRIGDRCVLIGATDQSIALLSELESLETSAAVEAPGLGFGDLLGNLAGPAVVNGREA